MYYEKNILRKKEWLFFIPFFAISILSGKLIMLNNTKKSNLLNYAVTGLEWFYCVMLIASVVYGFYKLIKKDYTLEKVWLFTGIFILIQFVGVYQFEILLKYYYYALNNVIFHDIMVCDIFSIIYIIFLLYYVIKNRNINTKNGLSKVDIIAMLPLLLLPFIRSINLYIFRDVIEGMKNKRSTIITRAIFTEDMRFSEKADIAEKVMDQLMLRNTYIDFIYPMLIYGTICLAGLALIREKITYQKYLALGGTFTIVQYLGITYFDKMLNCLDKTFYTANINMLYKIVLNYSYSVIYIIPLALYLLKKVYYGLVVSTRNKDAV